MIHLEQLSSARFSIEGDPDRDTFDGWHIDSHRWNGWAQPYFTRATVEAVAAMVAADGQDGYTLVFDGDTLVLTDRHDDDEPYVERIEPAIFDGVALYGCGFGWVWDTVDED